MFADTYKLSQAHVCDNLTVYFIYGEDNLPEAKFLTLQEAMEQKKLIVHETGEVNTLTIENLSIEDVYIEAGDMVRGGKQDRVLVYDLILSANSGIVPISSYCVERARWSKRRNKGGKDESVSHFEASFHKPFSKPLRHAVYNRLSQNEVWSEIEKDQDRLSEKVDKSVRDENSKTSLYLSLEDETVKQNLDKYIQELSPVLDLEKGHTNAIGYAIAVNGVLDSADIYSSNTLFKKQWDKLFRAGATQALSEYDKDKKNEDVTEEQVIAYLNNPAQSEIKEEKVTSRTNVVIIENDKTLRRHTYDMERNAAWVHRSCLVK